MPRITEHNDWVVFILFGCISAFVFMLLYLHREASLREFLSAGLADSGNVFPTWMIVSLVNALLLATLVSQFVPAVPRVINNFSLFGLSLNKFGYSFAVIAIFYSLKVFFGYFFYASIGQERRWHRLWFVASKFYFILASLLFVLVFVNYFYPVDKAVLLWGLSLSVPAVFIIKALYYLLDKNRVMPAEWYYKFLYICTLQIAPILLLWRLLFF